MSRRYPHHIHFRLDSKEGGLFESYLGKWFCRPAHLARRAGADEAHLWALIDAGAIPGSVYAVYQGDGVWSALSTYLNHSANDAESANVPVLWMSPAALPWLRQALLSPSKEPEAVALQFRENFCRDYQQALERLSPSLLPYADAIDDAGTSWHAWTSGAYAVCMQSFSAELVVNKLTRRLRGRELLARGVSRLCAEERTILLRDVSELSRILTPFSPFERPNGTPGTLIDPALSALGVGYDDPFRDEP